MGLGPEGSAMFAAVYEVMNEAENRLEKEEGNNNYTDDWMGSIELWISKILVKKQVKTNNFLLNVLVHVTLMERNKS